MSDSPLSNPFLSFDIGSGLLTLIVIILWITVIKAFAGFALKIVMTVVAIFALLFLFGVSEEFFGSVVDIMAGMWDAFASLMSRLF
jgi:hypothetical protein